MLWRADNSLCRLPHSHIIVTAVDGLTFCVTWMISFVFILNKKNAFETRVDVGFNE